MAKPRTRLDVSQKVLGVGDGYFFFFLPVVFFAFFAFFAFLATLPSAIPRIWFNASRPSTCINTEYTTIAKLILRDSKKVNGSHTVACCRRANLWIRGHSLLPSWRTSVTRLTRGHAASGKQLGGEAILLGAIACALIRAHVMFVATLSGSPRKSEELE